jgi:chemotaxis receptor (MCP) glutamine deamidase CheD
MKLARIQAGGIYVSDEPALVRTVLGSCVAVCLFDPVTRVGGMNHFMLPDGSADSGAPTRYGVHAMELLINGIMKKGGSRFRFKAKVFGASRVLLLNTDSLAVPQRNMAFIRQFLATERIPSVAEQLGGNRPLDVAFETHSGHARVRAFGWGTLVRDVVQRERRYQETLNEQPPKSVVTLF